MCGIAWPLQTSGDLDWPCSKVCMNQGITNVESSSGNWYLCSRQSALINCSISLALTVTAWMLFRHDLLPKWILPRWGLQNQPVKSKGGRTSRIGPRYARPAPAGPTTCPNLVTLHVLFTGELFIGQVLENISVTFKQVQPAGLSNCLGWTFKQVGIETVRLLSRQG